MVQLGIACITAYEGCFDLILTRSTTLIVLNGKSEGAGVAKLKQVNLSVWKWHSLSVNLSGWKWHCSRDVSCPFFPRPVRSVRGLSLGFLELVCPFFPRHRNAEAPVLCTL